MGMLDQSRHSNQLLRGSVGFSFQLSLHSTSRLGFSLAACLIALCCQPGRSQSSPAAGVVLDEVVAVVNNQVILSSDLDNEIRLSVLDPSAGRAGTITRTRALDVLISRALIEQQMRREEAAAATPTSAQLDARLAEIRREVPACAQQNCATEAGWAAFLSAHGLTPGLVEIYLRNRMEILSFIEQRFRQGIRVPPEEVDNYYHKTLLPQYAPGAEVPALETVAPRIEEILLQQRVNAMFDDWLKNLREQGDIEVLDPALDPSLERQETQTGKGRGEE
jgi:peptidyl-prolyl cis-trans isomerase SurA